jgi:signal transduction histidine kinase
MLSTDLENLDSSEIKDLSFTIHKSAKNIYNLLDNLLQWSKLQSGRIDFIPGCFSVNEIIEQAVSIFQPNAIRKKITLVSQIDSQLYAYADKNMIDTVIRNLLSNAIKFTHTGGRVKITAHPLDKSIIVAVTDSGIGLDSEQINNLFNLTGQNITTGTDKEKGTGLGLILCKEFIEKNNGTISVESEPGEGSKFTFAIPADKD